MVLDTNECEDPSSTSCDLGLERCVNTEGSYECMPLSHCPMGMTFENDRCVGRFPNTGYYFVQKPFNLSLRYVIRTTQTSTSAEIRKLHAILKRKNVLILMVVSSVIVAMVLHSI